MAGTTRAPDSRVHPAGGRVDLVLAWVGAALVPWGFLVLLAKGGEYAPEGAAAHDITAVVALVATVAATALAVGFGLRANRRGRPGGLAAALLGGGLGIGLTLMLTMIVIEKFTGPEYSPSAGDTSLSVLDTRVPITPGLFQILDADLAHPGEVSRVARLAEVEPAAGIWQEAFLAETVDGRLCLWIIEEGLTYSRGSSNGCQPRSELLTSGVYLSWEAPGGPADPDRVVILVPDGYTRVTAGGTVVPVVNNAAILGPIGDGTVVFTGLGKPNRTIRLDPTFVSVYQGDLADTQENRARIALTDLAHAARVFRDTNGTTEGFAAQFRAQEGDALFNQLKQFTDTAATAALDDGRCLTVTFPDGAITEAPC